MSDTPLHEYRAVTFRTASGSRLKKFVSQDMKLRSALKELLASAGEGRERPQHFNCRYMSL